jgi:hypothetical protein
VLGAAPLVSVTGLLLRRQLRRHVRLLLGGLLRRDPLRLVRGQRASEVARDRVGFEFRLPAANAKAFC